MNGKNLLEGYCGPESQTLGAVQALLKWQGKNIDQLPGSVRLDSVVLVLSSKRDQYYVCSSTKRCSCPSAIYQPDKKCKHQRKYFPSINEEVREALDPRGSSAGKYRETDEILSSYDGPCTA